ncbi:MAG: 4-hydroxythreonine-4-phosphate dehydrogenase PdxA [Candidatus Omnitrophota bacterium]
MRISPSSRKAVVITAGDPSGIGPEIILKSLGHPSLAKKIVPIIIGDRRVFRKNAKRLKIDIPPVIKFIDLENVPPAKFRFGAVKGLFGKAAVEYLLAGLALVKIIKGASLVTAPINKASINSAGFRFAGHTELLAHLTKSKNVTMMLVGDSLRVSLVTRHVPLKEVPRRLTRGKIIQTAKNTHYALKKFFGIRNPRIGVCGLNPHAGEGGLLGREEEAIISPAVKYLKKKIKRISGPLPADALFNKAYKGAFDAVVCMYHDQALIPLKMVAFEKGVNLTVGLPFIRTSPDHGTAFDIAGRGKADPSSMIEAIKLAARLC